MPSLPIVKEVPARSASNAGSFRLQPQQVPSPEPPVALKSRPRDLKLPNIRELEYRPEPLQEEISPLSMGSSRDGERARLMAEHRATLAAQPIPILNRQSVLPLIQQPSRDPLDLPLRLPPMSAMPPYRRLSYTEADRAQMLWSRSLASDVGSKADGFGSPTEERPASKRPRHY